MSKDRHKNDRPLAYSAERLARALDIGERTAWGLMASGEIRSVKIGARRLAPASEVDRYLAELLADQAAGGLELETPGE